jgi:hypothetical protein
MVRFSWKEERPYTPPSDRSELGLLEGVRLKRRKSFKYKMWRCHMQDDTIPPPFPHPSVLLFLFPLPLPHPLFNLLFHPSPSPHYTHNLISLPQPCAPPDSLPNVSRYDLTEVRGAPISSEEGLEAAIAGVPPSYEIEVELLRDCLPLGISPVRITLP